MTYTVTATDNVAIASIVCQPASGTLFGIGTTLVTCTATDTSGNQASATFTVTVLGAQEQLENLATFIDQMNLQRGITQSFDAKLDEALAALSARRRGSVNSACLLLNAFIQEVVAQAGTRTITDAQAHGLIALARQIKATLGCP